jgi:protein SCO1/2
MSMKRLIVLAFALLLAACGRGEVRPGVTDITGIMPDLQFAMIRANDGAPVAAQDYRGKVVILYFGYTHCPDECPTTLVNLASVLKALGPKAGGIRVLFVSVDPERDTLPVLKSYASAFATQIDGLRGTPNAIASLARRYRVLYNVTRKGNDVEVMHSDSTFLFDGEGHAREVMTDTSDTKNIARDVVRLLR